jgi:hypothetical protein
MFETRFARLSSACGLAALPQSVTRAQRDGAKEIRLRINVGDVQGACRLGSPRLRQNLART